MTAGGGRGRGAALALGGAGAIAVAVAGALLLRDDPAPAGPTRPGRAPGAPAAPEGAQPAAPGEGPAPGAGGPAAAGEADDPLAAAFDRFAAAVPVDAGPTPAELLAAARQDPARARDLRNDLERALARRPGAAREAAEALLALDEALLPWALPWALGLAGRLDGPATDALLDGLVRAPDRVRPFVVVALRGSAEPRVDRAFADLYGGDRDPEVRANAALALGERSARLDPAVRAPALARARDDLRGDDPQAWRAAVDVLGAPPLAATDRAWLEGELASGRDPRLRLEALRGLAGGGVPPGELRPLLERVVADASAGDALRAAAWSALEALERAGGAPR